MSEADQELDEMLSAYVDGELSAEDEQQLQRRLEAEPSAEPNLVATIEALRADRTTRAALWKSCEPDEAAVARLLERVDRAIDRQTVWSYRLSKIRIVSAAAACIVLGVLIGRVTFGPAAGRPVDSVLPRAPGVGQVNVTNPVAAPVPAQVRIVDGRGQQVLL